jgi:hypothetical protein
VVQHLLLGIEGLLRGFERLLLLVQLFLLGRNLFAQLGDVTGRGGALRETQNRN